MRASVHNGQLYRHYFRINSLQLCRKSKQNSFPKSIEHHAYLEPPWAEFYAL